MNTKIKEWLTLKEVTIWFLLAMLLMCRMLSILQTNPLNTLLRSYEANWYGLGYFWIIFGSRAWQTTLTGTKGDNSIQAKGYPSMATLARAIEKK